MPKPLEQVYQVFEDPDAYAAFLRRVSVAVLKKAAALRDETPPDPVTAPWAARQQWALQVLAGHANPRLQATRMLPGLVVIANDAGYLDDGDLSDVTDNQIIIALDDAFVDRYAGYVPEAS